MTDKGAGHSLLYKNSLGIPATCADYRDVGDIDELQQAVRQAQAENLPILVLGEGTNVVFAGDFPGLVVRPRFAGIEIVDESEAAVVVRVGAGENWHELVCWALERGYYGLENLALIPGSCGAAPVQNIGAYGVELKQFIEAVEYLDLQTLEQCVLPNRDCGFGYRESRFKREFLGKVVITHIQLRLSRQPSVCTEYPALAQYLQEQGLEATPENVFEAVCSVRRSKLPEVAEIPNVGSFFKNPVVSAEQFVRIQATEPDCPGFALESGDIKVPAGWLIERLGWKGRMLDGVGMHQQQALVLVNPGHRTGAKVLEVAAQVQADVRAAYGIGLEIEPRVIAENNN